MIKLRFQRIVLLSAFILLSGLFSFLSSAQEKYRCVDGAIDADPGATTYCQKGGLGCKICEKIVK